MGRRAKIHKFQMQNYYYFSRAKEDDGGESEEEKNRELTHCFSTRSTLPEHNLTMGEWVVVCVAEASGDHITNDSLRLFECVL